MDNKTLYKLTYGLFVLTTKLDEKDNGCIINTAIQAASEPNTISVSVSKMNHTHDMISESGVFNVSIISEDADFELFKLFGFQSGKETDKFAGFTECKRAENGIFYVTKGTNAYISAKVTQKVDMGSHTMFIAEVTDMETLNQQPSATYGYYHEHIKPQPQAANDDAKETVWRCTICNYEYVGEELPADYICPLCKHPASDFEKV